MSWSPTFLAELAAPEQRPLLLLESVSVGSFRPVGGDLRVASWVASGNYKAGLIPGMCSINWGRLTPGSWRRSHSSATFVLTGDTDIRSETTRGQMVQLRVGWRGWDLGEFEPVWVGMVRALTYDARAHVWRLDCVDLVGALTSRFTDNADEAPLFHSLGSTTLAALYSHGVSTTLVLNGTTGLEESSAGGGEGYLVEITPSSGAAPFYVHASTLTVSTLSGLTVGRYGTTGATAAAGSAVRFGVYSVSHPLNLARRVLASTGTSGANGSRDTLPSGWAYGIPAEFIAGGDIEAHVSLSTPAAGSSSWDLFAFDEAPNGLGWLEAFLAGGGFFLGLHQGQITARAVLSTLGGASPHEIQITDDDLVPGGLTYAAWAQDVPIEYSRIYARSGTYVSTLAETGVYSRPVLDDHTYWLDWCWSATADWPTSVLDRLGAYLLRVPEALSVQLRGWGKGTLSPGDTVLVSTSHVRSRDLSPIDGRRMLVVGGGPNFFGAATRYDLLAVPPLATE